MFSNLIERNYTAAMDPINRNYLVQCWEKDRISAKDIDKAVRVIL